MASRGPVRGADLIGYYAPYEGSATTAYSAYNIESLAYETYRARLWDDQSAQENFAFAAQERFILNEDRIFLRQVSLPHAPKGAP